jgi:D-inositol-3-phosphate glycosyltransferase
MPRYAPDSRDSHSNNSPDTSLVADGLGLFIGDGARSHDDLRRRPKGRLARWQRALLAKGSQSTTTDVRGNVVAADILSRAIIEHSRFARREIFASPWFVQQMRDELASYMLDVDVRANTHISSLADIVHHGVAKYQLKAWFSPLCSISDVELSQSLRRTSANSFYPISMLLHGIGNHELIYSFFLKIILEGTYRYDALVCSSSACERATLNILDSLAAHQSPLLPRGASFHGVVHKIPLCVDTDFFVPGDSKKARAAFSLPNDSFVMLYVGKVSPIKADLLPFLQVLRRLKRDNSARKFLWVIAGTELPGYVDVIMSHALSYGLRDNIKIIKDICDDDKVLLYRAADVFVALSDNLDESFGLTPIEAMSSGLPQVAADWSGYRDTVLDGQTGFLISTYWADCHKDLRSPGQLLGWPYEHLIMAQSIAIDLDQMRSRIQSLIDSKQLLNTMSKKSRERAVSSFSFNAIIQQYDDLWDELSVRAHAASEHQSTQSVCPSDRYRLFSHYASNVFSDGTQIIFPNKSLIELTNCVRNQRYPGFLTHYPIVDEATLGMIVKGLQELGMAEKPRYDHKDADSAFVLCGDLKKSLTGKTGASPESITRHLLWLLKYGYIGIAS